MQDGLYEGTNQRDWVDFSPRVDSWYTLSGQAPSLGTAPEIGGRYLFVPELHLCYYTFAVEAGASPSARGGFYLFELPVPAQRQMGSVGNGTFNVNSTTGGNSLIVGPGAVDRIIGQGLVLNSAEANVPVTFTVSDQPGYLYGTAAQNWCQAFAPYAFQSGYSSLGPATTGVTTTAVVAALGGYVLTITQAAAQSLAIGQTVTATGLSGTWTVGFVGYSAATPEVFISGGTGTPTTSMSYTFTPPSTTTATITYPWSFWNTSTNAPSDGFTYAPQHSDISLTWYTNPSIATTANKAEHFITSVNNTGFTVNFASAPSATAVFGWKAMSNSQLLIGQWAPWNLFGTAGDSVRGQLVYETAI